MDVNQTTHHIGQPLSRSTHTFNKLLSSYSRINNGLKANVSQTCFFSHHQADQIYWPCSLRKLQTQRSCQATNACTIAIASQWAEWRDDDLLKVVCDPHLSLKSSQIPTHTICSTNTSTFQQPRRSLHCWRHDDPANTACSISLRSPPANSTTATEDKYGNNEHSTKPCQWSLTGKNI